MRTVLFALAIAAGSASFTACSKSSSEATEATIQEVTVDQLDRMLASNDCTPVDANGDGTRKKMGVIPNAILLPDTDVFDAKQLPADKSRQLVFYCANNHCGASHEAAGKALTAGYKNVKVLPEGIAGWVKAGKKTQQPST